MDEVEHVIEAAGDAIAAIRIRAKRRRGANGGQRGPMDDLVATRGSRQPRAVPDAFGTRMDELRALIDGAGARWRWDALRLGEEGRQRLQRCSPNSPGDR